jgi:hypothetical protein
MSKWKKLEHALSAYILLGRVLGIPEKELQDTWSRGARDTVIAKALKVKPRKEENPGPAKKPGDKVE